VGGKLLVRGGRKKRPAGARKRFSGATEVERKMEFRGLGSWVPGGVRRLNEIWQGGVWVNSQGSRQGANRLPGHRSGSKDANHQRRERRRGERVDKRN